MGFSGLRALDIQVDDNRFLAAADHHGFHRLIRTRVHLLMRHEGRHVDEISGSGFLDELQVIAPAKAGAAANDVQNSLQLNVMVSPRAGRGLYGYGARP
jgi:hypothetical protein